MAAVQATFVKKIPFGNAAHGGRIAELWQAVGAIVGGTDTVGAAGITCNNLSSIEAVIGLDPTAAQVVGNAIASTTLYPVTVAASGVHHILIIGKAAA